MKFLCMIFMVCVVFSNSFEKIKDNIDIISDVSISILNNRANTPEKRNILINDVLKKDKALEDIENALLQIMQKNLATSDDNLDIKLISAHTLLNFCYQLRNSVSLDLLENFKNEYKSFEDSFKSYKQSPYYKSYKFKN